MRPKLYLATNVVTVMFLCEDGKDLRKEAAHFVKEESNNYVPDRLTVKEITSLKDIPPEWSGDQYLWGVDGDDLTARDFIEDPEYEEYKRLKAKFE